MGGFGRIERRATRAATTPAPHAGRSAERDETAPPSPAPLGGGNLLAHLAGPPAAGSAAWATNQARYAVAPVARAPAAREDQSADQTGEPATGPPEAGHAARREQGRVKPALQAKGLLVGGAAAPGDPGVAQFANGKWGKVQAGLKDIPTLMDDSSKEKTKTKQGTTWARRMDKTDQIADPTVYMSTPEIAAHLKEFKEGAHAFIKPEFHEKINKEGKDGGFGGWGRDANFVAPLSEANSLVAEAHKKAGLLTIEQRLGIPSGKDWSWAHPQKNPEHKLFRYILRKPDAFGLRMATGRESGAYKDEWEAGGKTLGGGSEAVIDKLSLGDLSDAKGRGDLEVKEESFPETPMPGGGGQQGAAPSASVTPQTPAPPTSPAPSTPTTQSPG